MQRIGTAESTASVTIPKEPHAIAKLIAKLRWIGMEAEAERLSLLLARIAPGECRAIGPHETD
jgi:hypothetical protein